MQSVTAITHPFRKFRFAWLIIWQNPIIYKELRGRMRGWRAFTILTAYLTIVSVITGSIVVIFSSYSSSMSTLVDRITLGRIVFGTITIMELFMICITAPALIAGSISNEKERQTYDLLRATSITPGVLISGKLFSVLGFVSLLLFSTLPLHSLTLLIGGVSYQEILLANLVLLVTSYTYCSVGIFFSSIFSRTSVATIFTYVILLINLIGIPLGLLGLLYYLQVLGREFAPLQMVMLILIAWLFSALNPISSVVITEILLIQFSGSITFASLPIQAGIVIGVLSPWIGFVIISGLFSTILILCCVRFVNKPITGIRKH